jgi:hypothetical protein
MASKGPRPFPFPEMGGPRLQGADSLEELSLDRDFRPEQEETDDQAQRPRAPDKRMKFHWEPAKLLKQRYGA